MKRTAVLLLISVLMLTALSGCVQKAQPAGSESGSPANETAGTESVVTTVDAETKPAENTKKTHDKATVDGNYEIEYVMVCTESKRNDYFNVNIRAKNISSETWNVRDLHSFFKIKLYTNAQGLSVLGQISNDSVEPFKWEPGKTMTRAFNIMPVNAVPGDYDLDVEINGVVTTFKNVLTVIE